MSQFPPFDDDQETRRATPQERPVPRGPMARPVMPRTDRTKAHFPSSDEPLPPEPEASGLYVPWWGFVLVILAVAGVTCGLWGIVLMSRGDASTSVGPTPTPIFVVITATSTLGAGPIVVTSTPPLITPQPGVIPTTPAITSQPPTAIPTTGTRIPISLGTVIIVTGTEGQGLRVRQGPGTDYTQIFLADEGEKFLVKDGPRQANGYTWWYIVDTANPDRFGWAVEDFMMVVP